MHFIHIVVVHQVVSFLHIWLPAVRFFSCILSSWQARSTRSFQYIGSFIDLNAHRHSIDVIDDSKFLIFANPSLVGCSLWEPNFLADAAVASQSFDAWHLLQSSMIKDADRWFHLLLPLLSLWNGLRYGVHCSFLTLLYRRECAPLSYSGAEIRSAVIIGGSILLCKWIW